MASPEDLYKQVRSGKVKLEQLNDSGKAALKDYMATKEKPVNPNKQYADAMKSSRLMEVESAKKKQDDFNETIYGGTNRLKSTLSGDKKKEFKSVVPDIQKVADQRTELNKMGMASTLSSRRALDEEYAKTPEGKLRSLPVLGPIAKGLDRFSEATKPAADIALEYYTPGAGLGVLDSATQSAGNLISKVAPWLLGRAGTGTLDKLSRIGGKIAHTAATEAIVGLPTGAGQVLANNPQASGKEILTGAGYGVGGGAVLGGLVPAVGAVGKLLGGSRSGVVDSLVRDVPEPAQPAKAADDIPLNSSPEQSGRGQSSPKLDELYRAQESADKELKDFYQKMDEKYGKDNFEAWSWFDNRKHDVINLKTMRTLSDIKEFQKKYPQSARSDAVNATDDIPLNSAPEQVASVPEQITPTQPIKQNVLNSSPGREPKPIKLDEEVIKFNESGVGDANTFGSKISREPSKKKGSFGNWWEKTRSQLVDDGAALEGYEKRITGSVASAEDSLYKSGRLYKGAPERAAQIVQDRLSPIVKGIEKSGHSTDDLGNYALAVHARDVNAAGIKSGFTNAEIEDTIAKFGTPEMEAARKELIQISKDLMKEQVDAGNVSGSLASVLDERWKNYIPLFRQLDDEAVDFSSGLSDSLANVASPIKALKGSEQKVIDPLENMVKNIFQSVNSVERNKVASQLHRLANIDTEESFIRRLGEGEDVGRKNVVNVRTNGENVKYEVEPEVYKALLNLDKESSGMLINVLSMPATLLRSGATLTPDFALRNPMRDVVQAFVVSKSGFNPITDFGAGLIQSIKKGPLYKEWIDNLGAYGNMMSMDRNVHRQALEKVLKEPVSKKFVNIINGKSLFRALRAITDTTESATKVGEYRAALRKGVSKQEAAYRSRDIMDFARAGSSVRTANKIVAFLNANVQGKSKLIRAIKENPIGTTTRAFSAVTVPTIGIFALNKKFANDTQRETIDNAPEWMRNSFWLMAIPGTDVVARIPKPFDLATIFSNLPERALEFVYDNDKEAFDGYLRNSLADSTLPTQISGLQPFFEAFSAYSSFRQGDIVPLREQGLKFEDQYDPIRTSETAKVLAKGANSLTGGKGAFKNFSSPRIMDNTIQGLTAGLGKYATDAIDVLLRKTGAVDRPAPPEKDLEQKPFVRSFLADPNQGGKSMDKFYSTIDELSREKASNKLNEVTFGSNNLPFEKNSLLKDLNAASDDVSDINKEIRAIEKNKLLTPHQKKMKIDSLITERKRIVKDSVEMIK